MVESEPPLTSSRVYSVLRDGGFKVFSSWEALGRELEVPLDYRKQLRTKANMSEDYDEALEYMIDYWLQNGIKNNTEISWNKLVTALDKINEEETALKIRKRFGIASPTPKADSTVSLQSSGKSKALKAFAALQDRLQPLIQFSINDFASKCFAKQLIPGHLFEKLFNHTPSSEAERTGYLIYVIIKRSSALEAKGQYNEARDIIRRFGEAVSDTDRVLSPVGSEIVSIEDSLSLMVKQDRIKAAIQSSLSSIAVKLLSHDLITDDEYDAATDPDSSHSKRHLEEIFRFLREGIKEDYQKYQTLLLVLRDMGPPISTAAKKIADAAE